MRRAAPQNPNANLAHDHDPHQNDVQAEARAVRGPHTNDAEHSDEDDEPAENCQAVRDAHELGRLAEAGAGRLVCGEGGDGEHQEPQQDEKSLEDEDEHGRCRTGAVLRQAEAHGDCGCRLRFEGVQCSVLYKQTSSSLYVSIDTRESRPHGAQSGRPEK